MNYNTEIQTYMNYKNLSLHDLHDLYEHRLEFWS
jgi:hypothetical protein